MQRRPLPFRALAPFVLPLLGASALSAQAGPCGTGNARLWCVHQDSPGVNGSVQSGDRFGAALAFGDFDGDGFVDLAVGSPGEADGIATNAGLVHVFYGSGLHLLGDDDQTFDQDSLPGEDGGTENGDLFGSALAAADFDGDGFDDLAIGSPGERFASGNCGLDLACDDAGVVHVVFGGASGLSAIGADTIDHLDVSPETLFEDDANFGAALVAGDLNGNDVIELLIGFPGSGNGRIMVFEWSGSAFAQSDIFSLAAQEDGDRFPSALAAGRFDGAVLPPRWIAGCALCEGGSIDAGSAHVDGMADLIQTDFGTAGNGANDQFGASLALGDFDGDGELDLAVGAPNKNHGTGNPNDSGRVYVALGPIENGVQTEFEILGEDDVPGQTPAAGERFGAALAAGDFDGNGDDDLVVGAPGEFAGDNGALFRFVGGPGGLTGVSGLSEGSLGGASLAGNALGSVLAAADLDGDGTAELAIGVPDATIGGHAAGGIVYVTRRLDSNWIFGDGFESALFSLWSVQAP